MARAMARLLHGAVLIVQLLCARPQFLPCPVVDASASFWRSFLDDPRPVRIRGPFARTTPEAFIKKYTDRQGLVPGEHLLLGSEHDQDGLIPRVRAEFPEPEILSNVSSRWVLSVGRKGSGESDILHHWHGIAMMTLLSGEKQWALRPPWDEACTNDGDAECNDPLDICRVFERRAAPCVQSEGEAILLPHGYFHGTCNTADWTIGLGGQVTTRMLQ